MDETLFYRRRRFFCSAIGLPAVLLLFWACPEPDGKIKETSIKGSPFGESFKNSSAGHKVVNNGAAEVTVVRIAPRDDVCAAVMDPADAVDPSLVVSINGNQVQKYQVVDLDYAGPDGGRPPPTATVTLQTYGACDAGAGEDAGGLSCANTRGATSGEVDLQELVLEGKSYAAGELNADFGEGGTVSGSFYAPTCVMIR